MPLGLDLDLIEKYNHSEVIRYNYALESVVHRIRAAIRDYFDYNCVPYDENNLWFRYVKRKYGYCYSLDIKDKAFKEKLVYDYARCDRTGISKAAFLYHLLGGWYGDYCFFHWYCTEKNNLDSRNELINNALSYESKLYLSEALIDMGMDEVLSNIDSILSLPKEYCKSHINSKIIQRLFSLFTRLLCYDKHNKYPDNWVYEFNLNLENTDRIVFLHE